MGKIQDELFAMCREELGNSFKSFHTERHEITGVITTPSPRDVKAYVASVKAAYDNLFKKRATLGKMLGDVRVNANILVPVALTLVRTCADLFTSTPCDENFLAEVAESVYDAMKAQKWKHANGEKDFEFLVTLDEMSTFVGNVYTILVGSSSNAHKCPRKRGREDETNSKAAAKADSRQSTLPI